MTPEPGDELAGLPSLLRFGAELHEAARRADAARAGARTAASPWRQATDALRRQLTRRQLSIAVVTLVVTGTAVAATVRLVVDAASKPASYDVSRFLGHGDAFDCDDIPSQAYAQAVLRADPSDPDRLDAEPGGPSVEHDGIACPGLPAPRDLTPVGTIVDRLTCRASDTRSARCPQRWRSFSAQDYVHYDVDEYDCAAFASQADAQAVLLLTPSDPNDLDGDGDGIACPALPGPKDLTPVLRRPPS